MKITELLDAWERASDEKRNERQLSVRVSVKTSAKISALAELFPGQTQDEIINDLLTSAIEELERSLPYIKGDEIISEDEMGDPIYADAGLTPLLHELTKKFTRELG